MRRTKYARITLVLLAVALLATPSLALAEEGAPQSSTNLLTNPSFESGAAVSVGTVAGGWSPWWLTGSESQRAAGYGIPPTYELASSATAPNGVRDGNSSQSWKHSFGTTAAGVYQTVTVPKNATIRFEAYGRGYSCDTPSVGGCPASSSSPSPLNLQIGLDPLGGTEFFSASTIRSSERNAYDAFQRFVLEVGTGGSDKVTVFLKYQPGFPAEINQAWWDQASLTVISGGQTADTTTTTTTTTTDDTTDTPVPEGSYEVKGGDTLGNIARRHNVTLTDLINLNLDTYPSMASNPDVIYLCRLGVAAPGSGDDDRHDNNHHDDDHHRRHDHNDRYHRTRPDQHPRRDLRGARG
jgi:hypothetical protein